MNPTVWQEIRSRNPKRTLVEFRTDEDYSSDILHCLISMLQFNPVVTTFLLYGSHLRFEDACHLCKMLQTNTALLKLEIDGDIQNDVMECIAIGLRKNYTLKELYLTVTEMDDVGFGDIGLEHLSTALPFNTSITRLDLGGNMFTADGIRSLSTGLHKHPSIQELYLDNTGFGPDGLKHLAAILGPEYFQHQGIDKDMEAKYNPTSALTLLSMDRCQIQSTGIMYLSRILPNNFTLVDLSLESNHLRDEGIYYLSRALIKNSTLRILNLQDNEITDIGASYLATMLRSNSTLESLSLIINQIGEIGIRDLASALPCNSRLSTLHLYYNPFEEGDITPVFDQLEWNSSLIKLGLSRIGLTQYASITGRYRSIIGRNNHNQTQRKQTLYFLLLRKVLS